MSILSLTLKGTPNRGGSFLLSGNLTISSSAAARTVSLGARWIHTAGSTSLYASIALYSVSTTVTGERPPRYAEARAEMSRFPSHRGGVRGGVPPGTSLLDRYGDK